MQDTPLQTSPEEIQATILKLKEFIIDLELIPDQRLKYTEEILLILSELLANKKCHKCKLQITSNDHGSLQSGISLSFIIEDKKVYISEATYEYNRDSLPTWSELFYR